MWLMLILVILILCFWAYVCLVSVKLSKLSSKNREGKTFRKKEKLISVLIPVAYLDHHHLNLLNVLANQQYGIYEIIIIYEKSTVSPIEDPHLRFVQNVDYFEPRIRSNKSSNLIFGLKHINPQSEFLVFLDDDVILDETFLRRFSYYIENYSSSIITSYRHIAAATNFREYLLLAANNCIATFMLLPKWHCIWGGCFGLHRELADKINLSKIWMNSISEDLDLTMYVRAKGISLYVTPEPLCKSIQFTRDFSELLSWGIRQFKLARFYASANYLDSIIVSSLFSIGVISFLPLLLSGGAGFSLAITLLLITTYGNYRFFCRQHNKHSALKLSAIVMVIPMIIWTVAALASIGGNIKWKEHYYLLRKHHGKNSPLRNFVH